MNNLSDGDRRHAFAIWLRTGRLPRWPTANGIELKFNPWHDPETGRFTFAGTGRRYGPATTGAAFRGDGVSSPSAAHTPRAQTARTWGGEVFSGGGGGRSGGGGATGTWAWGSKPKRRASTLAPPTKFVDPPKSGTAFAPVSRKPANAAGSPFRKVIKNGYTYQIDATERTRQVSGSLTLATVPVRSRTSQRLAGGVERRLGDDGGHYIAARFNGPTDAFNHFAQNANFNRGGYRALEDEWAKAKRTGQTVMVTIVPRFDAGSTRPSTIDISWAVNGIRRISSFSNERSEKRRGK